MNNKMGYFIIVIGLILIVWGLIIVRKSKTTEKFETIPIETIRPKIQNAETEKTKKEVDAENKAKGDAFESFVVKHFDKKYFKLQEWRGDKYVDGNYPISSHFPDLEVNFTLINQNVDENFAIECKWRKNYYKNSIEWAHDYQIKNYIEYSEKLNIPVFVIIGVGGEPEQPNELFIIPLSKLESNIISKDNLHKYKRKTIDGNFFWDFEKNVLK